jgi:hypothetical protein
MATYLEQYLSQIRGIRRRIEALAGGDFELNELKDLTSTAGLQTEHFIRAVVIPATNSKDDFAGVINALKTNGFSKEQRAGLHRLRELYNSIKHDPLFAPSIKDILEAVRHAETFAIGLKETAIGRINVQVARKFHRVFWVAGWDHFIGGDTEVHIMFPSDKRCAPTMDTIHISMQAWDKAKKDLATAGKVTLGKGAFPHEVYEGFRDDADFHEAFAFEGEYRDLVSTLAKYEFRVEGLIEPMHRENAAESMIQAFTLAALDVADLAEPGDLAAAIYVQVINLYAVSPEWSHLKSWCTDFGDLVAQIPAEKRAELSGPVWLAGDVYNKESTRALARHKQLRVIINTQLVMCLGG